MLCQNRHITDGRHVYLIHDTFPVCVTISNMSFNLFQQVYLIFKTQYLSKFYIINLVATIFQGRLCFKGDYVSRKYGIQNSSAYCVCTFLTSLHDKLSNGIAKQVRFLSHKIVWKKKTHLLFLKTLLTEIHAERTVCEKV